MAFGYDKVTGWNPATFGALLADIQDKYRAQTSANVDVVHGPAADMLRTVAAILKDAWDDQLGAYNSGFVSAAPGTNGVAEGSSLELLLTPKIGPKLKATKSTVVLPLTAEAGPNIAVPAGQTVALQGESGAWALNDAVVIPGGGSIDGVFEYVETGPKIAVAGSTWAILTPVSGWVSVGPNPDDAILGRNDETDAEYRQRYRESLKNNIIAAVRQVEGVTSASLIEWPLNSPDPEWHLTHWFELLVVGGANEAIARAIDATRAKGTNTVGNTLVELLDATYVSGKVPIRFSRPVLVPIYVDVTITKGEGYPTDTSTEAVDARKAAIVKAVVAYVSGLDAGENTSGFKIASYIQANAGIPGIDDIAVKVDIVDPPVNTGTLSAARRELFTVQASDINVTGA